MPLGTYRIKRSTYGYTEFVGVRALWHPLLDELAREVDADFERQQQYPAELRGLRRELPTTVFHALNWKNDVRECDCDHCGIRFLWRQWRYDRKYEGLRCCSNRAWSSVKRRWRERQPAGSAKSNARRTKKRADARTVRTCEHCGAAIEAVRSTKRFCSDICRTRAHYQRRKEAADG
jgi:hypothetical protein